jgi:hypothetical protein
VHGMSDVVVLLLIWGGRDGVLQWSHTEGAEGRKQEYRR